MFRTSTSTVSSIYSVSFGCACVYVEEYVRLWVLNCLSEVCVGLGKTEEGRQKAQQRGKVSLSSPRFLMWPNFPLSITNKPQE